MKPDPSKSFLQRIRNELHQMHPTERRLADFVLSFPGELASYTASELARLATVSNATVSRFVQRLGYTNYEEARRHVRSEQTSGAALYRVVSPSDPPEQILGAHLAQAHANIDRSFAAISLQEIDDVAETMLSARRVWIIGFRTSQSFATYLQWQVLQIIENAVSLPYSGQTLAEHVASIEKEDCVIVFGLRRQVRGFPVLLEQIVKTGARTMLVTDDDCERMDAVTWHFRCQTAAAGPLYNHVAVMALTDLLATRVMDFAGAKRRRRLSTIETLHEAMDEI
ncbi:MurR/RpiR family transcriptional regulator [Pararhizobium sp. YC-54]|uniref:MurR/RpiR family transcriptional regulator n=1 Tax=Pararhizobium sp. YC-54 TaxID=2986920 RepID=UPI0021F725F8|nr:MurR/RpiR family transcriptional regulator [Pararhizobium sp. YC-54]MCW0000986.1 MurR/RpiR family transcriptional regulator [Pararhizobium sp. YC-54]